MTKRFWFFDLDGTLADTDRDIRIAWKGAFADMGLECPDFDERFVTGPPLRVVAETFFPGRCDDAFLSELRAAFARRYDSSGYPNTMEYPGVLERVRALRRGGATTLIATNKRMAGAEGVFRKLGWGDAFDGLYAGDMYAADPSVGVLAKGRLLARAMEERGIAPADAVMVGDTASDFDAAEENGMESIGVSWGYGTAAELAKACRVVSAPEELA